MDGKLKFGRQCVPIVAALIMAAGMWSFFNHVVIPLQEIEAARKNLPRGNLSDLYPRWLGARELLIHQRDPYSDDVSIDIQKGFWGRPLDPRNPHDPADEVRFAYPLYVVFLLAPTVNLPFESVQAWYTAIAVTVSILSVWGWSRVFGEGASGLWIAVASTLLLGSYAVVQALHSQQLVLLVAASIAGAAAAAAAGAFWVSGAMLAVATIKPQVSFAIVLWLLLWSISRWRERRAICISFLATMVVLVAGAELLLPGWMWKWRESVSLYMRYAPLPPAQIQLMFGKHLGAVAAVAVLFAIGVFCWKTRLDPASTDRFKLAPALILTASLLVSPVWHNYDHVLVLPAALLASRWRDRFFALKPFQRCIVGLSAAALAWQWLAALVVTLTMLISPALAQREQVLPWLSILLVPALALISLFLLARAQLQGS